MEACNTKFVAYLTENKVKQNTIDALIKDDLDDLDLLVLVDSQYIKKLKLTTGQSIALTNAIEKLLKTSDVPNKEKDADAETNKAQAEDVTPINVDSLKTTKIDDILKEVQDADRILGDNCDPWLEGRARGKKTLLVQDFCGLVVTPKDDEEIVNFGASKLVTSRAKRVTPKETSVSQYLVGSTRILVQLLQTNALPLSMPAIISYLKYQIKIGEYLQTYSREKVMLLDQEYRLQQAAGQIQWGEDSLHLGLKYLTGSSVDSTKIHTRTPGTVDPRSGKEICRQFQSFKGCPRLSCKFSHVCIRPGCHKNHPEHEHNMRS